MDQDNKEKSGPDAMFFEWMKAASDFWLSAAKAAPFGGFKVPEQEPTPVAGFPGKMEEGWQALLKIWQNTASAFGSPQTLESVLKGVTASPEAAMKIARTTWDGYSQLYQMWLKQTGKLGRQARRTTLKTCNRTPSKNGRRFMRNKSNPC